MKELSLASARSATHGERTLGACLLGSQRSPQIAADFPSPIRQIAPLFITSLPLSTLFQAWDDELGFVASMTELLGK